MLVILIDAVAAAGGAREPQAQASVMSLSPWSNRPTYDLDVRPESPSRFSVYVECKRADLSYPRLTSAGVQVVVTSGDRSVHFAVPANLENGGSLPDRCDPYPFAELHYQLSRPLEPAKLPYTVTATTTKPYEVTSASNLLVSDVAPNTGAAIGSTYVGIGEPGLRGPRTGEIFRYVGVDRMQQRVFVSKENKRNVVSRPSDPDHSMDDIAPAYNDADTQKLQEAYLSVPVTTKNFEFTCYNAKGEYARVKLRDGKFLRIVTIVRAAHALRWIANDPRKWIHGYPCDGSCSERSGVFVDSPIVVAMKFDPDSVDLIPPTTITHIWRWSGNCIGGYVLFANVEQFVDVFAPARPPE